MHSVSAVASLRAVPGRGLDRTRANHRANPTQIQPSRAAIPSFCDLSKHLYKVGCIFFFIKPWVLSHVMTHNRVFNKLKPLGFVAVEESLKRP